MKRLTGLGLLVALGLTLGLWLRPTVLALYHLEAGGQALVKAEAFRVAHPAADNEALEQALRHFEQAVVLAPTEGYACRRLGQAWLLAGNNDLAQQALSRASELRPHDPMVHIELGHAWDGLGQAAKAVAEYEQGRYGPALSEATVNYLKLADWQIAAQGGDAALEILNGKILPLDPHNLPALYRVASIYEGMSNEGAEFALPIREQIKEFPADSVAVPSEPRLAEYLAQTMIQVTEDGTWTRETLLSVVAYQVWQFAEGASSPAAERVMQTLVGHWPHDADLLFYQGELYHRRGDLEEAETIYRQVVKVDPAYAQANLRLGMVAEAKAEISGSQFQADLDEAIEWYERYHSMRPDDLLGLRKLTEAYEALGKPESTKLREELESKTDDRRAAAKLLGVSVEDVHLGLNLVENGDLEQWEGTNPARWGLALHLGQGGDRGLYLAGKDALGGDEEAARIAALWRRPLPDGTSTYAEYIGSSFPVTDTRYLVSVDYCFEHFTEGVGLVFVGDYTRSHGLALLHQELPLFDGQCRRANFLVDGPVEPTTVTPLVRNWGIGDFWLQALEVRPIRAPDSISLIDPRQAGQSAQT